MTSTVEIHPAALDEAQAARDWYAERSDVLAGAFVEELEAAIDLVAQTPERWPVFEGGTRRKLLAPPDQIAAFERPNAASQLITASSPALRRPRLPGAGGRGKCCSRVSSSRGW